MAFIILMNTANEILHCCNYKGMQKIALFITFTVHMFDLLLSNVFESYIQISNVFIDIIQNVLWDEVILIAPSAFTHEMGHLSFKKILKVIIVKL